MRFFSREVMAVVEEPGLNCSHLPAAASLLRFVAFARDGEAKMAMSKKPTSAHGFSRATNHSLNVRGSLQPSSEPPVFDKLRVRPSLQRVSALCLLPSHRARARGAGGQLHAIDANIYIHHQRRGPLERLPQTAQHGR